MSKKTRTLIFSAAGLLLLTAALVVLMLTREVPEEELPPEPVLTRVDFTELTPEDIVGIIVKNEQDEYIIEQSLSGGFEIPVLLGAPLNQSRLHNAARYMSGFWARDIVEENAADLEKYGLGDRAAQAVVSFVNGETLNILIGDRTLTADDMTYVRLYGENNVYVVWSHLVSFLKEPRYHYVSLMLTEDFQEAGFPSVERVEIERAGEERFIIEAYSEVHAEDMTFNKFRFTEPVQNIEVDTTRGQNVIIGLYGLIATDVVYVGEEIPEEGEFALFVEMTVDGKTTSLTVRAVLEDESGAVIYQGVHSDFPEVLYTFAPESLPWLDFDIESIMATLFLQPYIYTVTDFIIETPEHTLSFLCTGEGRSDEAYFLDGEPIETAPFKDLYIYAICASATGLFTGEPDEIEDMLLLARYTYTFRETSGRRDIVAEFYDAGNLRSVIVLNGEPLYTTSTLYLTRLNQNIEAYLSGEKVISWP